MSKPNQLFLLADHIKLSLLERQRAKSLNLEPDSSQDGHIARSLEQFGSGLQALRDEERRLRERGDEDAALNISDSLPALQSQLDDLTSQFHGVATPTSTSTLTHPNNPSLAGDFTHATTLPTPSHPLASNPSTSTSTPSPQPKRSSPPKTVRFSDTPQHNGADDPSIELFARYRDEPPEEERRADPTGGMTNEQIHAYHASVLADQDSQLDSLGESIGRQRELSMRMGDELEAQCDMLDETDGMVDRQQSRLDRAGRSLGRISRAGGEGRQMMAIIACIIVLILLIAILK